jgi:hypothetical protein
VRFRRVGLGWLYFTAFWGMMKHFVAASRGVVAVAVAVTVLDLFAGGVAAADGPQMIGKTYGNAAAELPMWGYKATIATVIGSQVATDDCIVVGSRKAGFLNSSGRPGSQTMLLDLDCNGMLAAPGKPGNSAASPTGQLAKKELAALAWLGQDPEANCRPLAGYCKQLCIKYAANCTPELTQFVASLA